MDNRELWQKICCAFPILVDSLESECTPEDFEIITRHLIETRSVSKIIDIVLASIETYLRKSVAPSFWSRFVETCEELEGFDLFKIAVNDLYIALCQFGPILERLEKLHALNPERKSIYGESNAMAGFKQIVRATLLSQLPLEFQRIVYSFYKISFNVFCMSNGETEQCDITDDLLRCAACGYERENDCQCEYIVTVFHDTNHKLVDLQLLERLTGQVLTNLIQTRIENHVQESCKGKFEDSHIADLEKWLDTTVMTWLTRIYCAGWIKPPSDDIYIITAIEKFRQKLSYYLYETYTRIRIDQLFNIIIEYPDSQPAIEDIKICLGKTDLRSTLSRKLQAALETRLLHPGVNTADILTAYIAAIKVLRHLDPSGVLLVTVTQPVRNYLRTRDDTIRSVVSSLTEEGPESELADELARVGGETTAQNIPGNEEDIPWDQWNPDPVDADPNTSSKYHRTSDIISMLVNVYGSKELFVNEYRTLLADRLLVQGIYNTEKELRYLELLKIRFGESQLNFCDVMLKDILDSKRINAAVHDPKFERTGETFPLNGMILSAQFWPPFKEETLELPSAIKEQFNLYKNAFEKLKGNRSLSWKYHLGTVNIEVEIGNKKLDMSVSPMQATLIMHFQTQSEWDLDDLSQMMKVPATVLRRKMTYWQSKGLITEISTDKYILIEEDETGLRPQMSSPLKKSQEMICEEEDESPMASALDQREGELQRFWSYITGMLTNLDPMPLERIHQMLKLFASEGPHTECSLQELRHFLETKVRNHQLILQGGFYKLPKS